VKQAYQVTRTRIILVVAIVLLVAQNLFMIRFGEPYPAIMLPGFAGSRGYKDGSVKVARYETVFVADGEEFPFSPKVLLSEFPDSHHGAIAKSFTPPKQLRAKPQVGPILEAIFPGYTAWSEFQDSSANGASLKDWLRSRGRVLVPGRTVSRVEFRWFHEIVRVDGTNLVTQREPLDTLTVWLEEKPK
jgi:hypothetical protein